LESERLARRYFELFGAGVDDAMLEIVHPDVELVLRTRPGDVLRGREAVAEFVRTISDRFYEAVAEVYRPVDERRIVVEGRMRWTDDHHVMRDAPTIWALEFRDGLLLRSFPAQTILEAESILTAPRADDNREPE
jgi:ketosteroid isomerase-like protein